MPAGDRPFSTEAVLRFCRYEGFLEGPDPQTSTNPRTIAVRQLLRFLSRVDVNCEFSVRTDLYYIRWPWERIIEELRFDERVEAPLQ